MYLCSVAATVSARPFQSVLGSVAASELSLPSAVPHYEFLSLNCVVQVGVSRPLTSLGFSVFCLFFCFSVFVCFSVFQSVVFMSLSGIQLLQVFQHWPGLYFATEVLIQ